MVGEYASINREFGGAIMVTSDPTRSLSSTTALPSSGEYPTLGQRIAPITLPGISGGVSPQEAKDWFASLKYTNKNQYNLLVAKMASMGIPKSQYQKVWDTAVAWTQSLGNKDGKPTSFLDIVDPADFQGTGGAKYGTSVNKQIQTTQYSPSDAANTLNKTIETELGRTATAQEQAYGLSQMNAAAAASPATGTYTTTTSGPTTAAPLGTSVTKSTQQTGFDPAIIAQNIARSLPDFAESFAAKNFLSLVEKVLKDPNAIGKVVQ